MLVRLGIRNVVIISEAEVTFRSGMTAITGESGVGKSLVARALSALIGGESKQIVGPHGEEAWVEGEFELSDREWDLPELADLKALKPPDEQTLVLGRSIAKAGRSRQSAWGKTISTQIVKDAAPVLMTIAAQHDQRRLAQPARQREMIDLAGGPAHDKLVKAMRCAYEDWHQAAQELQLLLDQRAEGERRRQELIDALELIDAVDPDVDEHQELLTQRSRAQHLGQISQELTLAQISMEGTDEQAGADVLLRQAARAVSDAAELDPTLRELAEQLSATAEAANALSAEVAAQLSEIAEGELLDPDAIEQRVAAYEKLLRRFGPTVEQLVQSADEMREQLLALDDSSGRLARAQDQEQKLRAAADEAAQKLSASRQKIADKLVKKIQAQVRDLAMEDAQISVEFQERDVPTAAGQDDVQILLAANTGMEAGPLSRVASGGEMSRVSLAIYLALSEMGASVLSGATMLMDEVDAGIGGQTATAVAQKLYQLSTSGVQLLVITHLPQVAAGADQHVLVHKSKGAGTVCVLEDPQQVEGELVRMLAGSDKSHEAAPALVRQMVTTVRG